MLKKIVKLATLFCIIAISIILFSHSTYCLDNYSYLVNTSDFDDYLRQKITILKIYKKNSEWHLLLNDTTHKADTINNKVINFSFVQENTKYDIAVDIEELQIDIQYGYTSNDGKTINFYLTTENGTNILYVYIGNEVNYKLTGQQVDGQVVFKDTYIKQCDETLHCQFIDDSHLLVEIGNYSKTCTITNQIQQQEVFLEKLVEQHTLPIGYFSNCSTTNFLSAKNRLYSLTELKALANQEKITLVNKTNGLSKDVSLAPIIGYWKRLGEESYDTSYSTQKQVVGNYEDDICDSISQSEQKTYHIFGQDYSVKEIVIEKEIELYYDYQNMENSGWLTLKEYSSNKKEKFNVVSAQLIKYANVGKWSSYKYSYDLISPSIEREVVEEYSYQTYSYSDFGEYKYTKDQVKEYSDDLIDSKTMYARSTLSWSAYSEKLYEKESSTVTECENDDNCKTLKVTKYGKTNAVPTGKTSGYVNACLATDEYRCDKYYKYTCSGLISSTAYSAIKYNTGVRGPCKAGKTIEKVQTVYKKAYISFSEPTSYDLDSCTSTTSVTKCFSKDMYKISKASWSNFSDYKYLQCKGTTTTKCKSTNLFAIRNKIYSDYSSYVEEIPTLSNISNIRTRYRYREREILSYGLDYSLPVGTVYISKDTYYKFDYPVLRSKEISLYNYSQSKLGVFSKCSEDDINEIAQQYNKIENIAKIISSEGPIKEERYNVLKATTINNSDKYKDILNAEIYVPNVYVLQHYRATKTSIAVHALSASGKIVIEKNKEVSNSWSGKLAAEKIYDNENITFFDQQNPFNNLDEIPDNYSEEIIEKIKESLQSEGKYVLRISEQDKKDIYEYVKQYGTDNLIERFDYLFVRKEE